MKLTRKIKQFFGTGRLVYKGSAPGRLDVMGGIADYSGGYVLQKPIAERTTVYAAKRQDGGFRLRSESAASSGLEDDLEFHLEAFYQPNAQDPYRQAKDFFATYSEKSWAAYLLGCVLMLIHEEQAPIEGLDVWVQSRVPIGKGVSSSAALEVATLSVLCNAFNIHLTGNRLPRLAQQVENQIAGAPCGLMDQLATYWGRTGKLLPILCRPDQLYQSIPIPNTVHFIGVDSGARHSVGGSSYTDVRTAAFMGYSLIAHALGYKSGALKQARETGDAAGLPYKGYLSAIAPSEFEQRFSQLLPDVMSGAEFLPKYKATIDSVVYPQPKCEYRIHAAAAHPVYEHHRVRQFALLLELLNSSRLNGTKRQEVYHQLGELMYQAHQSYSRCGLGSPATDSLVDAAREYGPDQGVFGAKITGGGSGGTVCFLCIGSKGKQVVKRIADEHAHAHNCPMTLFAGSSEGAQGSPVERVRI